MHVCVCVCAHMCVCVFTYCMIIADISYHWGVGSLHMCERHEAKEENITSLKLKARHCARIGTPMQQDFV